MPTDAVLLRRPPPPLDTLVEVMWLSGPAGGDAPSRQLALPTGAACLVVNVDGHGLRLLEGADYLPGRRVGGPLLRGLHTRPFAIQRAREGRVLGVQFRPGAAATLLLGTADTWCNQQLEMADLDPASAGALMQGLERAGGEPTALMAAMDRFLGSLPDRRLNPVVTHALSRLTDSERPPVGTLVDESGLSHRRFGELFRDAVGVGPKRYARIARFQQAVRRAGRRQRVDWADLAHNCGHCDQAHFANEFRRHAGLSPGDYLARRGDRPNHPRL